MSTNKESMLATAVLAEQAGHLVVASLLRSLVDGTGLRAWAVKITATDSYGRSIDEDITVDQRILKEDAEQCAYEKNCKHAAEFTDQHDWYNRKQQRDICPAGLSDFVSFLRGEIDAVNIEEANAIISIVCHGSEPELFTSLGTRTPREMREDVFACYTNSTKYEERAFRPYFVRDILIK